MEKRKIVSQKIVSKYLRYHDKYREMRALFKVGGNLQSLRDEMDQKDEELVRTIGR